MAVRVAIIGGTGVGELLLSQGQGPLHVPTREGLLRGQLLNLGGVEALLIGRHSAGHKVPPHLVNYKAMALGLQSLGVRSCLASAAVGSLVPEWGPGELVVCSDFYDLTARNLTLYDRVVVHTDFSTPFGTESRNALIDCAGRLDIAVQPKGIYICGNGPRYETPHEIQVLKQFGDLVGMTAASEAILMREAGVDYACLAVVTNFAAGVCDGPLSHEEVVAEMKRSGGRAVTLLTEAAKELGGS